MARSSRYSTQMGIIFYLLISLAIIFLAILPLENGLFGLPGPNILLVATFVCIIRRPEIAPTWCVALVFLFADMLLMRAPGLMTAGVVLAVEYLRARDVLTTEVTFLAEWSVASSMIASVLIGTAAILVIFSVPAPSLGPLLIETLASILFYPVAVYTARLVFAVSRPSRTDEMGFGER